jgi:hypothetical protein
MNNECSFTLHIELTFSKGIPRLPHLAVATFDPIAATALKSNKSVLVSTAFHMLASAATNLIDLMVNAGPDTREYLVKEFNRTMEILSNKDAEDLLNLFKQQ